MKEKTCNKCEETKPVSDFYKRTGTGDGYRNECKECKNNAHKKYMATSEGREAHQKASRLYSKRAPTKRYLSNQKWREENPNKYKAHGVVAYAIKKGELSKKPCEECSCEKVHAHHDDYAKPLEVRWLCSPCHNKWHEENGEALNAS